MGNPEKEGQSGKREAEIALRVALVHASPDAAVATQLSLLLKENGVEIVGIDSTPAVDGLIVLMSESAFAELDWLPAQGAAPIRRAIPVRIGTLEEAEVPKHLSEINWIDWKPERPATTLGFIVTALLSDPSRYRVSQQLAHEATTWDSAGRPAERLIGDRRRARRMGGLVAELQADPLASPDPITVEFITASEKATRKVVRRRRIVRGIAALAAFTAFSVAVTVIPRIQANARISRAAIVTTGNDAILNQMPEWSAANAAALLIHGTSVQQELGRSTLIQAMERTWQISYISFIDSVITEAPFDQGRKAVVLALAPGGSGLAVVNVTEGQTIGSIHLPRRLEALDLSPDDRLVAAAGHGVATFDLHTKRVHLLTAQGRYAGVRVLGNQLALWTKSGQLALRSVSGGGATSIGDYESVLDVAANGHGGGSALVAEAPGEYAIVDLESRAVVSRARVTPGDAIGALSQDGLRAVVGGDDQFWMFGMGGTRPTGIPIPVGLNDLEWTSGERLLVVSDSERGEVFFIPRAERLGRVCALAPRVTGVRVESGGETVACAGDARSFWRLPAAPRESHVQEGASSLRGAIAPYAKVTIRGQHERLVRRGVLGSGATEWTAPFDSVITAATFSRTDHQLALGSSRGSVLVLGLTRTGTRGLTTWKAPDRSPVVALRWSNGLWATTESGQSWPVPTCPGCETDAGLIAAARARFHGCYSAQQMEWLESDVREQLGLRECDPILIIGSD